MRWNGTRRQNRTFISANLKPNSINWCAGAFRPGPIPGTLFDRFLRSIKKEKGNYIMKKAKITVDKNVLTLADIETDLFDELKNFELTFEDLQDAGRYAIREYCGIQSNTCAEVLSVRSAYVTKDNYRMCIWAEFLMHGSNYDDYESNEKCGPERFFIVSMNVSAYWEGDFRGSVQEFACIN